MFLWLTRISLCGCFWAHADLTDPTLSFDGGKSHGGSTVCGFCGLTQIQRDSTRRLFVEICVNLWLKNLCKKNSRVGICGIKGCHKFFYKFSRIICGLNGLFLNIFTYLCQYAFQKTFRVMTASNPHRHTKKRLIKTVGAHTPCTCGYMQDGELYFYTFGMPKEPSLWYVKQK